MAALSLSLSLSLSVHHSNLMLLLLYQRHTIMIRSQFVFDFDTMLSLATEGKEGSVLLLSVIVACDVSVGLKVQGQ